MSNKIKVYVAGIISPKGNGHPILEFLSNVKKGIRFTVEVILAGYIPFCPFIDFLYWFFLKEDEQITEEMIKGLSMVWLEASDAVLVRTENYWNSRGTLAEISRARALNIPVFYSLEELKKIMPPDSKDRLSGMEVSP